MACPNFADGSKTAKFMNVFSLESFLLYGILPSSFAVAMVKRGWGTAFIYIQYMKV